HETAGAARIRHSLRPLIPEGGDYLQTSGASRRGIERLCLDGPSSLREALATNNPFLLCRTMDCFASLAMTAELFEFECAVNLIRIARGEVARDFRAFLDIAADRDGSRGRAGPVGLLKAVIAAMDAGDQACASLAGGGFGVDQRLHLVAPFRAFIGAANAAQIMQGAEDFGEPLQIAIERRGGILGPRGDQMACR